MSSSPADQHFCFVSYSTREPHVEALIECTEIVMKPHFEVVRTPSALQSGASQRDQITRLIGECSFGIVVLDGLRPNIVFEYGILHGMKKPVILFKEDDAEVDIRGLGFFRDTADSKRPASVDGTSVTLDLDRQFSNVKDVNYAVWKQFEVKATIRRVWEEYCRKRQEIQAYVEIPEPRI